MALYDEKTALIVVDMQNDFADPSGNLYVNEGDQVVRLINDEIERAQSAGAYVVYTQDWHPESTPHFEKDGGTWPVHCVKDTWGAAFHPGLKVLGDVVKKGTGGEDGYSGFSLRAPESGKESSTELEALLRDRGIEKAVVVGLAADVCVRATALDAQKKGFATTVLQKATRGVDLQPGDTDRTFQKLSEAGVTVE